MAETSSDSAVDLREETPGGLRAVLAGEMAKVKWTFHAEGVARVGGPTAAEIEAQMELGGS